MKTIKLKSCPFCGESPELKVFFKFRISCPKCKFEIQSARLKDIVRRWNTRVTDEAEETYIEVDGVWIKKV